MLERFTEENPGECTALTTDATSDSALNRLHMLCLAPTAHACLVSGFDFSNAEFSGNCPDPRKFMGGIRHR